MPFYSSGRALTIKVTSGYQITPENVTYFFTSVDENISKCFSAFFQKDTQAPALQGTHPRSMCCPASFSQHKFQLA